MARREQEGLPGIPQATKRKIIDEIEELCLQRDKKAGKRTALSDEIAGLGEQIQAKLKEHKLEVYTYQDDNEVLQDVFREEALKKRKSKLNPKKAKAGKEAE